MKGYYTGSNYMGYVCGSYMKFATEEEYEDYVKGEEDAGSGEETGD